MRIGKLHIVILSAILLGWVGVGFAQDYARVGERSIIGTARYVGFGGAMSAIGGDPSAAHDNPAGLGLYRRAEVMLTLDEILDFTKVQENNYTSTRGLFSVPQASIVLSFPTFKEKGILFQNVMFSYHRLRTFDRNIYATRQAASPSLGRLLLDADVEWDIPFCADPYNASSALQLYESGQINEFAIDWAMNISNQWFVGAGLHFQSSNFYSEAIYAETFEQINEERKNMSNRNEATLLHSGAGITASLGVIYRPTGWLRLGFGMQTASLGALRTYTTGTLTALTDSLRSSYAPDLNYANSDFHMPWHTSTSVAFQIGAYGMIALQYDFLHQKNEPNMHSLRAGFEVIPVLGLYINAGYAYESTFYKDSRVVPMDNTFERQDTHFQHPVGAHYASFAIGYRGTNMMVQAAYQYCRQGFQLWMHENADPFNVNADTHKIILTLGWHRAY
ncbi:MAG: hypothetical protein IKX20_08065 [Paludibacteraceae bacterium]|nr:hypothetical protein [Paludibacteraceae bacterium]